MDEQEKKLEQGLEYTEEINDRSLDRKPLFYKNMSGQPAAGRLVLTNTSRNTRYITEFLQGRATGAETIIRFKQKYKTPPLVVGLLEQAGGRIIQIFPDNVAIEVTNTQLKLGNPTGNPNFPVAAGERYFLRVYNLDLPTS